MTKKRRRGKKKRRVHGEPERIGNPRKGVRYRNAPRNFPVTGV